MKIPILFNCEVELTFNLRGESHEKELPENADAKASGGGLYPLEAFLFMSIGKKRDLLFLPETYLNHDETTYL
ncbi:MAG: hypothetical protein BA861_00380 [Desulfobacterales bacterium S3730MH5]|jgi:hypothetical protein|nr:MAG: hypothetical protein BA861_00380 [Desulfobacterales bacterium S3730MH5]